MEVKLRLQEDIIYKLPFPTAQYKLKMIEEMDKEQKKETEKAKASGRSHSAPAAPKRGHVKLPTVNSLKISR